MHIRSTPVSSVGGLHFTRCISTPAVRVIQTLFIRMLVLHLWIKSDGNCCLSPLVLEIKTTLHLSVKVITPLHHSKHFCSSNRKKDNNFISIYSCLFTHLTQLWAPVEMSVVASPVCAHSLWEKVPLPWKWVDHQHDKLKRSHWKTALYIQINQ